MDNQLNIDDAGVNQERIWQLLHELRQRESSEAVKEDIRILKHILQNLIFQQQHYKKLPKSSPDASSHKSLAYRTESSALKLVKVKVSADNSLKSNPNFHNLLKYLQKVFLPELKSTEKLVFVGQQAREIRHLVVKPDEIGERLIVIGPGDIKKKSKGQIHIGDQILALNQNILNPLLSAGKNYTAFGTSTAYCKQNNVLNQELNTTTLVNSYDAKCCHLAEEEGSGNIKEQQRKKSNSSASNCAKFTEATRNRRLKQSVAGATAEARSITSTRTDDDDNDGREASKRNVTLESDAKISCSSISSALLIDRYEKLIEEFHDSKSIHEESENCSASVIVVTLLRQSPHMVLTSDWTEIQIIHLPNIPGVGLGFGIVGGTSSGVVVKTILPGSIADKDGHLCPGDHILRIRGISVHGMSPQQIASILRRQDTLVELVVGRPVLTFDSSNDTASRWTMPTRAALCPEILKEQIQKHTAMGNETTLSGAAGCGNNDADTLAVTNGSVSASTGNPGPSELVSSVFEVTDSLETQVNMEDLASIDVQADKLNPKAPSKTHVSMINNSELSEAGSPRSLRQLQEMALTAFSRRNWAPESYKTIEVELRRDPILGLGITVAGYVHKKEEINGVFVKSLVPNSSAFHSKKIQLNDLILEVNGKSLEGLNHSESVRTLVKSGSRVKIKLIRFLPSSPQAECLNMLQRQEATTQVIDVPSTLPDVVADWKHRLGPDFEVVSVDLIPDKCEDGGLGISLEGTVDILNGTHLCPHHYIDSLRPGGPAAFSNALRSGDELLQANDVVLYGESHVTVRQALIKAASNSQRVRLTVARKVQTVNVFMPRPEESLPIAYPLLAATDDRLVKAKSETCISKAPDSTTAVLEQVSQRLRSRSLQLFNGLAIWRCVPMIVQLEKDSRGLGFSIVDYRDPLHPGQSVVVVRSLVPGGLAQADGRIIPGDRLMFINDEDLSNSTLEHAVAVLKSAPDGLIRLGIAKPIPIEECGDGASGHSPLISRSERVLAKGTSPRSRRRHRKQVISCTSSQETVWLGATEYRRQFLQGYHQSSGSLTPSTPGACSTSLNGSHLSMTSWSPCSTRSISPCASPLHLHGSWAYDVVYLPPTLERSIKIQKGALSLGIVLNADVDKGINGCQVKSICSKKAIGRDGRVQVNDYIVKVNMENLRNVTNSQARAILKRTNLIGTQCNITYITASDAKLWKEKYHQNSDYQLPVINRLSPKIFPKFYRSPYFERKQEADNEQQGSFDSDLIGSEPSGSSEVLSNAKRQSISALIDGRSIEKFVNDFIQTLLKDIWPELLAAEHLPEGIIHSSSSKERQSLLSEQSETVPSTSVEMQKIAKQLAVSDSSEISDVEAEMKVTGRQTSEVLAGRKEKEYWQSSSTKSDSSVLDAIANDKSRMISGDRSQNSLQDKTDALSHKLSEAEQLIVQDEVRRHTLIDAELIEPSVLKAASESPSSPLSPEICMTAKSNRFKFWGQTRTVMLHREPNQSFGISIVGGRVEVSHKSDQPGTKSTVSGIFIKSVLPNSPAGLSNMMNMGDRVISVNDYDLREATHEQAVQVIKNARNPVKFVVQSLHSFPSHQTYTNEERDESREGNEKNMKKYWKGAECNADANVDGISGGGGSSLMSTINATEEDDTTTMTEVSHVHDSEFVPVEIAKKENIITSASVAAEKSKMQKRAGQEFEGIPIEVPLGTEIIRKASYSVDREKDEGIQSSLKRDLDPTVDVRRRAIDARSAAALPKRDEDPEEEDQFFYTKDKIDRKYGNLRGDTILLKLEKVPQGGLGLSLASNRERDEMNVIVVAVKSTCPLSVKIGDELLEVNGKVLSGLSHLNASSVIRECCIDGILELLLLRRFETLDKLAVKLEPKLSRSQTDPIFAAIDKTVIPGARNEGTCINEPSALQAITLESGKPDGSGTVGTETQMSNSSETGVQYSAEDGKQKSSRQNESIVGIETGRETLIEIDKDGKGLGLSIVGGSDTVLGTVVIHEVYPDGAAAVDGRLKPGDQVLEVNGVSLRGVSHEQAILLLRRTPTKVSLLVYRDVNLQLSLLDPTQIYNIFEMELTKKPGRGLGLSIVGRKNEPGVYVSEVVKGGAAEADGRLIQGDQILAVNGQDVASSMQEDVAAKLKACTGRVTLKVGRWKLTEAANKVHAATEAALSNSERCPGDATQLSKLKTAPEIKLFTPNSENSSAVTILSDRKTMLLPSAPGQISHSKLQTSANEENHPAQLIYADLSPVTEESSSGADQKSSVAEEESSSVTSTSQQKEIKLIKELNEENSDSLLVVLKKIPDQQLGMGIGKRTRGILVTSLQPGSVAAEKLKVGDRLMAVNGVAITDQLSAVALVKASGKNLCLQISRPRVFPNQ